MSPIERLNDHQRALLDEIAAEWTAVALDSTPTDRARAEAGIYAIYQRLGLPYPRLIVWCDSPLGAVITAMAVRDIAHEQRGYLIGDAIKGMVFAYSRTPIERRTAKDLRALITRRVERRVRDAFAPTTRKPLDGLCMLEDPIAVEQPAWDGARRSVRESLSREQWASMPDEPWQSLRRHLRHYRRATFQGQYEADWLSYYDFFRQAMLFDRETRIALPLMEIARSASWMIATSDICWIAERHATHSLDDEGRAHNAHGPALAYPDGLALYAWHGVAVPEEIILRPESITIRAIEAERNVEVRRVMIERYGEDRFIEETSEMIHQDEAGVLYRRAGMWAGDREPHLVVKVLNSTVEPDGARKAYFLRVPPDMETAQQAVAWTFGLEPEEYAPLIES